MPTTSDKYFQRVMNLSDNAQAWSFLFKNMEFLNLADRLIYKQIAQQSILSPTFDYGSAWDLKEKNLLMDRELSAHLAVAETAPLDLSSKNRSSPVSPCSVDSSQSSVECTDDIPLDLRIPSSKVTQQRPSVMMEAPSPTATNQILGKSLEF